MKHKVVVNVDERAVPTPALHLIFTVPLADHDELRTRRGEWSRDADELLSPLRSLPECPAESAIRNLAKAIAEAEAGVKEAERDMARFADDAADAVAEGKPTAKIEERAATASARLASLNVRLPSLKERLKTAQRDRNAQQVKAENDAPAALRAELRNHYAEAAAKLDLAGDLDAQLDRLATLQHAIGTLGST